MVGIRDERASDAAVIRAVVESAFETAPHSSGTEPSIIDALRAAGALSVSLVAVEEGDIVGHVAFSPVTIDGGAQGWFGLGPVAVRPDRQQRGIGDMLIRRGLERLMHTGANGCVVLGEPGYYGRFGFESDPALGYGNVPPGYFQRIVFKGPPPAGEVAYHSAFAAT
jgi:putative acetyltransferase